MSEGGATVARQVAGRAPGRDGRSRLRSAGHLGLRRSVVSTKYYFTYLFISSYIHSHIRVNVKCDWPAGAVPEERVAGISLFVQSLAEISDFHSFSPYSIAMDQTFTVYNVRIITFPTVVW